MSSFQSEFYSLTSSFSELAGSISYNLPAQGSHASCQCSLEWLNGKVCQCMLKLQCKFATKHWHRNICEGVVTISITISNTSISLPLLQLRKITVTKPIWAKICLCFILVYKRGCLQMNRKKVWQSISTYLKVNAQCGDWARPKWNQRSCLELGWENL